MPLDSTGSCGAVGFTVEKTPICQPMSFRGNCTYFSMIPIWALALAVEFFLLNVHSRLHPREKMIFRAQSKNLCLGSYWSDSGVYQGWELFVEVGGLPREHGGLVQFSHSVISYSLWPHGLQHARLPCPSATPGACSNSCPLSRWSHSTITSSVLPFCCLQSFPASGSFPMSQVFTSGGQSTGISASASILPMNIQDWFSLGWTSLISLQSKGLSRIFSNTTIQNHQFFGTQLSL